MNPTDKKIKIKPKEIKIIPISFYPLFSIKFG